MHIPFLHWRISTCGDIMAIVVVAIQYSKSKKDCEICQILLGPPPTPFACFHISFKILIYWTIVVQLPLILKAT